MEASHVRYDNGVVVFLKKKLDATPLSEFSSVSSLLDDSMIYASFVTLVSIFVGFHHVNSLSLQLTKVAPKWLVSYFCGTKLLNQKI